MKRRIKAIILKEFIHIIRDPRSLAVVIVLPFIMLLVYGFGINNDVKHLRTAVLDQDKTQISRDFLSAFSNSGYFDFVEYIESEREIDALLGASKVTVTLTIPKGFAADLTKGTAEVQIIADASDSSKANLAIGYASQICKSYTQTLISTALQNPMRAGIDVRTRFWYNPELKSSNFVVPGLIALILMMVSALLTSMTIVRERERGTIEQIVVSPIMPIELVIGKLIPYAVIAFADILIVILGGLYIFHVPLEGSFLFLLGESVLFLVAALSLGMFISCLARSQLTAMMIAVVMTMLPTVILSGFVFPISAMPVFIRPLTYLIPASYFLVIVRGIFLKGVGIGILWPQTLLLLFFGVMLIIISTRRFKKVL